VTFKFSSTDFEPVRLNSFNKLPAKYGFVVAVIRSSLFTTLVKLISLNYAILQGITEQGKEFRMTVISRNCLLNVISNISSEPYESFMNRSSIYTWSVTRGSDIVKQHAIGGCEISITEPTHLIVINTRQIDVSTERAVVCIALD
jgi:hypothetical protein